MLDHLRASCCGHQRCHGGDVDGVSPVASRAHDVHGLTIEGNLHRVVEHCGAESLNLLSRLALRPKRHQQRSKLHIAGTARENLVERPLRSLNLQALPAHQAGQDIRPGIGHATFSLSSSATWAGNLTGSIG